MVVITVSGVPGAGSSTIAKSLAERLGLKHFSVGDYYKKRSHERLGGKTQTDRALQFLQDREGSSPDFHADLEELQRGVAKEGNVVIDGKLSVHMLAELWTFSVWITASYDARAKRVESRDNLSHAEAMEKIKQRERIERKLWTQIYEYDYFDQEREASLVLDTSEKTVEESVAFILKHLPHKS